MKTLKLLSLVLLLALSSAARADADEQFQALLDENWEWNLKEFPMLATSVGDRRYNDRWTDQGLDAYERRQREQRDFLSRLYGIDRQQLPRNDSSTTSCSAGSCRTTWTSTPSTAT